jgi:hypothetical protein
MNDIRGGRELVTWMIFGRCGVLAKDTGDLPDQSTIGIRKSQSAFRESVSGLFLPIRLRVKILHQPNV